MDERKSYVPDEGPSREGVLPLEALEEGGRIPMSVILQAALIIIVSTNDRGESKSALGEKAASGHEDEDDAEGGEGQCV